MSTMALEAECVICFLPVTDREALRSCVCSAGQYHKECILEWMFKYNCRCPVCQRNGKHIDLLLKDLSAYDLNEELVKAVRENRSILTELLLGLDADPNQICDGYSLLDHALLNDREEIATLLLKDLRTKRQTSMAFVVNNYLSSKTLSLLIENGGNVNYRETGGKTVLMQAVENSKLQSESNDPNAAVLQFTSERLIAKLLEAGAKVNVKSKEGYTALMLGTHSLEITQMLVTYGADIHIKTAAGATALTFAANNPAVKELLSQSRTDTKKRRRMMRRVSFKKWRLKVPKVTSARSTKLTIYFA